MAQGSRVPSQGLWRVRESQVQRRFRGWGSKDDRASGSKGSLQELRLPIELLPLRQSPTGLDCGVAGHGQDGCAASAPPCFASVCTAWLRGSRSLTQAKILVDCDGVGRASCNRGVCRGRYLAKFPHVTFQMLLDRLSPRGGNGFAVNIGAEDGQNHDPIYPLFERGYAGLAIEAEPRWHDALIRNLAQVNSSQQVFIAMERVSPVTLPSLLRKFRVPSHFML